MQRAARWPSTVWIAAIAGLALLFRLILARELARTAFFQVPLLDAAVYDRWARAIAGGDLLGSEVFYLAPLYPYLCGLLYAIFPDGPSAVIAFQHLAGASLAFLAGLVARALGGALAGIASALLVAAYGLFILYEQLILPEILAALVLTAGIGLLVVGFEGSPVRSRPGVWLVAGVFFGLDALVRPTALLVAGALAVWILLRSPGRRRLAFLAFVLGASLIVLPVTARNRLIGGEWVAVTASGGFNFYVGNHREADGSYVQPVEVAFTPGEAGDASGRTAAERAAGRPLKAGEVSGYWYRRAFDFIRETPGGAARLFARKLALVWNRASIPQIIDIASVRAEVPLFRRINVIGPGILMPLALLGLLTAFRGRPGRGVLVVGAISFTLATALFFVTERYRVQVVPLLAMIAGGAVAHLVAVLRRGEARGIIGAALGLALAVVVVQPAWLGLEQPFGHPWIPPMNRALALAAKESDSATVAAAFAEAVARGPDVARVYVNRGEWYRLRGDHRRARGDFERAARLDPDDPLAWSALGSAQAAAGDTAALTSFARARALDPSLTPAALGLGRELLRRRRPHAALAPLTVALGGVDSAAAHDALGVALHMTGNSEEGFRHLERAVRLDPERPIFWLHLGLARAESGRLREAEEALARTLHLDPGRREARLALTLIARDRGQNERARAHLDTLLRFYPDDREARALLDQLDRDGGR